MSMGKSAGRGVAMATAAIALAGLGGCAAVPMAIEALAGTALQKGAGMAIESACSARTASNRRMCADPALKSAQGVLSAVAMRNAEAGAKGHASASISTAERPEQGVGDGKELAALEVRLPAGAGSQGDRRIVSALLATMQAGAAGTVRLECSGAKEGAQLRKAFVEEGRALGFDAKLEGADQPRRGASGCLAKAVFGWPAV